MKTHIQHSLLYLGLLALPCTLPSAYGQDGAREGSDVKVGAGNVQVEVDGDRVGEAVEERREERQARRDDRQQTREEAREAREEAREIRRGQEEAEVAQRASEILGMEVRNADNKQIGSVKDIVLDVTNGKVRYAAVSYGGFLGIGDKLFAVPWKTFACHKDKDGDFYLVLDVAEETLRNAPGFSEDKWPDFGNPKWSDEVDTYYLKDQR